MRMKPKSKEAETLLYCQACKVLWSRRHNCKELSWNSRKDVPFRIVLTAR